MSSTQQEQAEKIAKAHWATLSSHSSFRWLVDTFMETEIGDAMQTVLNGTAETFDQNKAVLDRLKSLQQVFRANTTPNSKP